MSFYRTCFLVACLLPVAGASAFAQSQNQNQNKPTTAQSKPTASQQLNYANQGTAQRNHTFDGTRAPANPVRANTAPKPNPVGQQVTSTANNPGYKPAPPRLHTNPVPSPTTTVARSTSTATSPTVTRSTTTPTVSRSTTTTTSTIAKKP
jgi:hypothetical protein